MATKHQTSIGGTVEVPADGTARLEHRSDGGEWINLVEAHADATPGVVTANAFVEPAGDGKRIPIMTRADDGEDSPVGGEYPIELGNVARARFLTLIQLDRGDRVVFDLQNSDPDAAHKAHVAASAAGTLEVALGNGGSA